MSRKLRLIEPGVVYHIFNRRTDRQCLFDSTDAFDRFVDLLEDAGHKFRANLCAYCVMETHWHLVLTAREPAELEKYVRWVSTTHAVRFRMRTVTRGNGHVYQDRYKSVAVDGFVHYATLIRYIEANPIAAGLVARAEDWKWSSLKERASGRARLLAQGPWPLPQDWLAIVNASHSLITLMQALQKSMRDWDLSPVPLGPPPPRRLS